MSKNKECKLQIQLKNKSELTFIENNCSSFGCHISNIEWKSKYNSFVVYDYEPFCPEGFNINITLSSDNDYNLWAFKHYYDSKMSIVDNLNYLYYNVKCYKNITNTDINLDIEKYFG